MRLSAFFACAMLLVCAGCQYDGQYGYPPRMIAVNVDVSFPKAVGRLPVNRTVEVPYGSSVLDATMIAMPELSRRGYEGTTVSGYLSQMYHLQENEPGKRCGWTYTVNGEHPSPGPKGMPLMPGDQVEWRYNSL